MSKGRGNVDMLARVNGFLVLKDECKVCMFARLLETYWLRSMSLVEYQGIYSACCTLFNLCLLSSPRHYFDSKFLGWRFYGFLRSRFGSQITTPSFYVCVLWNLNLGVFHELPRASEIWLMLFFLQVFTRRVISLEDVWISLLYSPLLPFTFSRILDASYVWKDAQDRSMIAEVRTLVRKHGSKSTMFLSLLKTESAD